MITCTFLGHNGIFDYDIQNRLLDALEYMLEMDKAFMFLFSGRDGFLNEAWGAVQLIKRGYPEKKISIALVGGSCLENEALEARYFDHIIYPLKPSDSPYPVQQKKRARWCIDHAGYVIAYFYRFLYDAKKQLLYHAEEKNTVTVIDITSNEVRSELLMEVKHLHGREREVLERVCRGEAIDRIAEKWGVQTRYVQRVYRIASYRLNVIHRNRLYAYALREKAGLPPNPYCQIQQTGPAQETQFGKITIL